MRADETTPTTYPHRTGPARPLAAWRAAAIQLTLLQRFALLGALVTATLAGTTGFFLSRYLIGEALRQTVHEATMVATHLITPGVSAENFDDPSLDTQAMWRDHLDHIIGHFNVVHVKIWNAEGNVIFSDDPSAIGDHSAAEPLRRALGGQPAWRRIDTTEPESAASRQYLGVFIPITLPGNSRVLGAYEVYRNYAPILAKTRQLRRTVWLWSLLLFGLLFGSLFLLIRRASLRLEHMAYHDPLTGLANRHRLRTRTESAMASARRNGDAVALLYLDLARFKAVNDTLGHGAGDALLGRVADRLRGCVRPGDTVARVGGDEFVILLEDFKRDSASARAERVIASLRKAYLLGDQVVHLDVHVGAARFPQDATSWEELMNKADAAMYRAKARGVSVQFFEADMVRYTREQLQLEEDLRQALRREELQVHYQPITAIRGGNVVGVEALARWFSPAHGAVSPLQFIPLAEDTGLIRELDRYVLQRAIRQAVTWVEERTPLQVAVNLSAASFADPAFTPWLTDLLRSSALDATLLTLEITERVLVDSDAAKETLEGLSRLGVRLALDDFGTGYSSLSYLESLPIDVLKIDRSFVHGIAVRPAAEGIAKTIVSLAKNLDLEVLAEGVEEKMQLAWLTTQGCDLAQGYLLGRPGPADTICGAGASDHTPAAESA